MSENAIDSDSISNPAPVTAKPKGAQICQKGQASEEANSGKEAGQPGKDGS
jgi:hypothetical protein